MVAGELIELKKELTDESRKQILTLLRRGIPFYRDLYVDVTQDPEFVGYAKNEVKSNRHIEAAKGRGGLSIYQKGQIARELENKEIARKFNKGEDTQEEVRKYAAFLKEKESEIKSKLNKAEAALAEEKKAWSAADQLNDKLLDQISKKEATLRSYEREIVRLEEKMAAVKAKTGKKTRAAREARAAEYEKRIKKLTTKSRALREALTSAKQEAKKAATTIKTEARLKRRADMDKLRDEMRSAEAERKAAARILAHKRHLLKQILKDPGEGIWHATTSRPYRTRF
jgi:chromosome segregation ATPase